MFGFRRLGGVRPYALVNNQPAALLHLDWHADAAAARTRRRRWARLDQPIDASWFRERVDMAEVAASLPHVVRGRERPAA